MYGCESWTVKKAEHRRIDAFELWCWRRLLESPLDCKEIQPVHSEGDQPWDFFGGNDTKAETPVLWPPRAKSWLMEKTLMLGGIGGKRRRGRQRMRWLDGITDSMDVNSGSWCWTGRPGVLWFMGSQRVGHDWVTDLIWSDLGVYKQKSRRRGLHEETAWSTFEICHEVVWSDHLDGFKDT